MNGAQITGRYLLQNYFKYFYSLEKMVWRGVEGHLCCSRSSISRFQMGVSHSASLSHVGLLQNNTAKCLLLIFDFVLFCSLGLLFVSKEETKIICFSTV